jgi:hypothetical protein
MPIIQNQVSKQEAPKKEVSKQEASPATTRLVIAAKKILAQPAVAKLVVSAMEQAGDPAQGIAEATLYLLGQVLMKSKSPPREAIVPAAQEMMVDVAKLGQAAGLFKITPDLIKKAVMIAVKMVMEHGAKMGKQAPPKQPPQQPAPAAPAQAAPAAPPMGV